MMAEVQQVREATDARKTCFQTRRASMSPDRVTDNVETETAMFSAAANFPLSRVTFPLVSTFVPCFQSPLYYLNNMDTHMASTKEWTDNCMGWVPPYSQIYISVLLYMQTMRAMEVAGVFTMNSELQDFLLLYPIEKLWIPGPLVPCFKYLACFNPTVTGGFGNVTPALPLTPGWSREKEFSISRTFASHLPHIGVFISRLNSICEVACQPNINQTQFSRDVNGPRNIGKLFQANCNNNKYERRIMSAPGASLTYAGDLRLWQNAADMLGSMGMPPNLDLTQQNNEVPNSWTSFLRLDHSSNWFGTLAAMMSKYCQFWRGSCSLSDCAPEGSAAGAVRLTAVRGSSIFKCADWSPTQGEFNHHEHWNTNQFGHYVSRHNATLSFDAATTIEDLPDLHAQAAQTFNYNMLYKERDAKKLRKGPFWNIHPDTYIQRNISVYQAVLASLVRESRDYQYQPPRQHKYY